MKFSTFTTRAPHSALVSLTNRIWAERHSSDRYVHHRYMPGRLHSYGERSHWKYSSSLDSIYCRASSERTLRRPVWNTWTNNSWSVPMMGTFLVKEIAIYEWSNIRSRVRTLVERGWFLKYPLASDWTYIRGILTLLHRSDNELQSVARNWAENENSEMRPG